MSRNIDFQKVVIGRRENSATALRAVKTLSEQRYANFQVNVFVGSFLRDAHSHGYYCGLSADYVESNTVTANNMVLGYIRMIFGIYAPWINDAWGGVKKG